jgi:hypothetical protein
MAFSFGKLPDHFYPFIAGLSAEELTAGCVCLGLVLPALLILGGDIVHGAIAQLAGGPFTPVAFSFGKYFESC